MMGALALLREQWVALTTETPDTYFLSASFQPHLPCLHIPPLSLAKLEPNFKHVNMRRKKEILGSDERE